MASKPSEIRGRSKEPPPPLDRKALRDVLRKATKTLGTIGADRLIAFLKDQEFDLKLPAFVVRQGLRSLLRSKVDELCDLPESDLRNLLRLIDWNARLALGEVSSSHLPMAPHDHPAVRASMERAMQILLKGDFQIDDSEDGTAEGYDRSS